MASRADNLKRMFESDPAIADLSVSEIKQAYLGRFNESVGDTVVREARKAFRAEQTVTEDEEPELDDEGHETFGIHVDPEDDYDTDESLDPEGPEVGPDPVDDDFAETADKTDETVYGENQPENDTPADDEPVADDQPADAASETDPVAEAAQAAAEAAVEAGEDPIAAAVAAATAAAEAAAQHAQTEPEIVITREPVEGRCNHRMLRAGDLCGRPEGHPGVHTTFTQLEKKKGFSKARAKVRYHSDPEYRERAKSASKASHAKARAREKAAKEAAAANAG